MNSDNESSFLLYISHKSILEVAVTSGNDNNNELCIKMSI